MKIKKEILLGFFIVTLLVIPFTINVNTSYAKTQSSSATLEPNDLSPHAEIIITRDEDFGSSGYNFPGDGSPGDPYRIENYNITSGGAFGIFINGTGTVNGFNVSFIIKNCWITALDVCIRIIDAYPSLVTIDNCTCINTITGDGIGIWIQRCDGSILLNNTCNFNLHTGIRIDMCHIVHVEDNTCYNNGDEGIYIDNAADNGIYLSNKVILNGGFGILNEISHNNLFQYNLVANNSWEGIYIATSLLATIVNNTIETNGIGGSAPGIYFENSHNGWVAYNNIIKNEGYGLYVDHNSDFLIAHHNNFITNNMGGTQAYEGYIPGHQNATWYEIARLEGNYWNEHVGPGVYNIAGPCNNIDPYPLNSSVIISEFSTIIFGLILLSLVGLISISYKKK